MESAKQQRKNSEAIWINQNNKSSKSKQDFNQLSPSSISPSSSSFRNSFDSGFIGGESFNNKMSISARDSYKRSLSTNSYVSGGQNGGGNGRNDNQIGFNSRPRTMTVGNDDYDFPASNSNQSINQSPFRRSNSISSGAGGYGGNVEPNFGGIIKRSMGQLFNAATINTSLATASIQKSVPKVSSFMKDSRKNSNDKHDQMTDQMVSYLCESAIR